MRSTLRGAASRTHLMEMLITLATPALQGFGGLARREMIPPHTENIVPRLDSCHAYSRRREVIRIHSPDHYQARGHPDA